MRTNREAPRADAGAHGLGREERDRIRDRLLRERDRLARRVARDVADMERFRERVAARDPCAVLSPDAASEDAEHAMRARMADEAVRELTEVETAIERLESDPERFGICEACGGRIEPERLDLIPHARGCGRCAVGG